jgi:hypothetical protein
VSRRGGASEAVVQPVVQSDGVAFGATSLHALHACRRGITPKLERQPKWNLGDASKPVMRSKAKFTDLQGQYLAFIQTYTMLHRVAPAEADMQRFFRVTPPTVHRMVLALEQRGLVKRVPGQSRSIRLLISSDEIPKLGAHGTG